MKAGALQLEKETKSDASHRAWQQHPPEDARQSGLNGIETLAALLYELVESSHRFRI
jgi:hypothetical protein